MSSSSDSEVEMPATDEDRRQSDKASTALPRRSFISDMPDRGLFALFAIGGFALIMFTKERELLSPVVVASIAAVLMIVYGVAAFRMPGMQARLDRLGDNFYYLGFIYTLASLSAALL